jgi:hypothetical protein
MARSGLALPVIKTEGDQVIPQMRLREGIGDGFRVAGGGAHGNQVNIGVTIKIAAGARSEHHHRFDANALSRAPRTHLLDLATHLCQPVEKALLPDSGQGGKRCHGWRLEGFVEEPGEQP